MDEISADPQPTRRFRLIDLMVIVAASAFSFWLYGVCVASQIRRLPTGHSIQAFSLNRGTLNHWMDWFFAIGFAAAVPFGIALMILGLLPPRPSLRERPGLLACLLVSFLPFRQAVSFYGLIVDRDLPPMAWNGDIESTGVTVCWLTLWIAGNWRRPTDWVETAAVGVGIYWLLEGIYHFLLRDFITRFSPLSSGF